MSHLRGSTCLRSDTWNHVYKEIKYGVEGEVGYECYYCKERLKKPNQVRHIHSYQAFPGKDLIFCTTCGHTKTV